MTQQDEPHQAEDVYREARAAYEQAMHSGQDVEIRRVEYLTTIAGLRRAAGYAHA